MVEARGNINYGSDETEQIGVEQIAATLHFGTAWNQNPYCETHFTRNNARGYHTKFHKYEFIWDETGIQFLVDDTELGNVAVAEGFWVCMINKS